MSSDDKRSRQFGHCVRSPTSLIRPAVAWVLLSLVVAMAVFLCVHEKRNPDRTFRNRTELLMHAVGEAVSKFRGENHQIPGNGKTGLSWRVHVLPFLGQAALYSEFHLDERWDSPHNSALIKRIPEVYSLSGVRDVLDPERADGTTCFLAVTVDGSFWSISAPAKIPSAAAAIVQVVPARSVVWTKPDDWEYDPAEPLKDLRVHKNTGLYDANIYVITADGTELAVPLGCDRTVYDELFMPSRSQQHSARVGTPIKFQ